MPSSPGASTIGSSSSSGSSALVGAGVYSAANLNVEAYPDPTPPLVEVITQNPGASPEEMERLVSRPLETALNGMPGLEALRSTSIAGLSDIKCQFTYGTDYWRARARSPEPHRLGRPPLGRQAGSFPLEPDRRDCPLRPRRPGLHDEPAQGRPGLGVEPLLKQVPGVIDVTGYGGTVKQYQVLLDTRAS